jgi:hypothetical protein
MSHEANASLNPNAILHEAKDADVRRITGFGIGLVLFVLFGLVVSGVTFHYFVTHQSLGRVTVFSDLPQVPPSPRLQLNSAADESTYLKQQQKILNTYGWENRASGTVRIPIRQAMDDLLKKGLPTATAENEKALKKLPVVVPPHNPGDFGPPPEGMPQAKN